MVKRNIEQGHGLSESTPGDGRSQSRTELSFSTNARETLISENQLSASVGDGNNGDSAVTGIDTTFFAAITQLVWIRGSATRCGVGDVLRSSSSGIVGKLCHSSEGLSGR